MRRCDRCQHYFGYPPGDQPDRISFSGGQVRGGGECRRNPPVVCDDSQPIGSFPIVFNDAPISAVDWQAAPRHEHRDDGAAGDLTGAFGLLAVWVAAATVLVTARRATL